MEGFFAWLISFYSRKNSDCFCLLPERNHLHAILYFFQKSKVPLFEANVHPKEMLTTSDIWHHRFVALARSLRMLQKMLPSLVGLPSRPPRPGSQASCLMRGLLLDLIQSSLRRNAEQLPSFNLQSLLLLLRFDSLLSVGRSEYVLLQTAEGQVLIQWEGDFRVEDGVSEKEQL